MADDTRLNKRQLKKLVKEQGAVLKQDPNNLVARLKLAGALKDLGSGKEAVGHYQAVAQAYVESGKIVQAISVYKGILEIAPGDTGTEAALTELSARRAQEIKRKSLPRLQQVDGRWVMPTESSASEEEGTDPGRERERTPSATPSVLRLPAHVLGGESVPARRSRRSRPRLPEVDDVSPPPLPPDLQEDTDGLSEPMVALPPLSPLPSQVSFEGGVPGVEMTPQTTLPNLFDKQRDGKIKVLSSPSQPIPAQSVPSPVPHSTPAPGGTPAPVAPSRMATPQEPESDEPLDEPTSPGPRSYSETIRKSAASLDLAGIASPHSAPAPAQGRRTLVGVPLPDHPDLVVPPRAPDLHSRPTPSVPLPAITRAAVHSTDTTEKVDTPRASDPITSAGEPHQTRALRKLGEPDKGSWVPAPPPAVADVSSEEAPEETLGSVFDEDEEALWAELSNCAPDATAPSTAEPDRATRSLKPALPQSDSATHDRAPRVTLPMPSVTPHPDPSPSTVTESAQQIAKPNAPPTADHGEEKAPKSVSLESVPLFRDLSEASRELLSSRVVTRREKAGTEVVREGDPGNALFVVSEGRVKVTKAGKDGQLVHLATLGPGAFFGEFALLSDRKRHATVTAEEDSLLFEISRKVIADLTRGEPAFGNTLRAFYRRRLLSTLVSSAPFFESLSDDERESLMGRLRFRRVTEGTKIITEGEPGGGFFLILIGQVQVTKTEPDGGTRVLARLGDGAYFGEMSLLKGGNAVATVTTISPTEIVQLAAAEFYRVLAKYPQIWEDVNQEAKRRALANLQILSGRSLSGLRDGDGVVM